MTPSWVMASAIALIFAHLLVCAHGLGTHGGNADGDDCVFPFKYRQWEFSTCTDMNGVDGQRWCATTNNYNRDKKWGVCEETYDCRFGFGCEYLCHCKDGAECDEKTGVCPNGCDEGRRRKKENSPEMENDESEEENSPEMEDDESDEENSPETENDESEEENSPETENDESEEENSPETENDENEEENSPEMENDEVKESGRKRTKAKGKGKKKGNKTDKGKRKRKKKGESKDRRRRAIFGIPDVHWELGAWSGPSCQIGNVAFGKPAYQGERDWYSYDANLAVDGNRNPNMEDGYCSHSFGDETSESWWRVDLLDTYLVYSVEIINRIDYQERLSLTIVEVSNHTEGPYTRCGYIYNGEVNNITIDCEHTILGRYVQLRRDVESSEQNIITICEAYIIGSLYKDPCKPGTWGVQCFSKCNCGDPDEACDIWTGDCHRSGCQDGFVGDGCVAGIPWLTANQTIVDLNRTYIELEFEPWTQYTGNGSAPTGYYAQFRKDDDEDWITVWEMGPDLNATAQRFIFSNLDPGTLYTVRIVPFIDVHGDIYTGKALAVSHTTLGHKKINKALAAGLGVGAAVLLAGVTACCVKREQIAAAVAKAKDGYEDIDKQSGEKEKPKPAADGEEA